MSHDSGRRTHAPTSGRQMVPLRLLPSLLLLSLAALLAIAPLPLVSAQLAFLIPDTCAAQRFDIASLSCRDCPVNSSPSSSDAERCQCHAGFRADTQADDAYDLSCFDCVAAGLAANRERSQCMACSAAGGAVLSTTTRECVCPTGHVLVEYDQGGSLLSDGKHCVPCSNSTVVFPAVDPYTCQTCPDALMNMQQDGTCVCQAPYSNVPYGQSSRCVLTVSLSEITAQYSPNVAAAMQYNDVRSRDSDSAVTLNNPTISSIYIYNYFGHAATNCFVLKDRHACQTLGNMCVLQKYHQGSTACQAFHKVQSTIDTWEHGFVGVNLVAPQDGWKTTMPFLYTSSGVLEASSQLIAQEVTLTDTSTPDNSKTGTLQFRLFEYTFNGSFVGWSTLGSQLQLCGGDPKLLLHYLRFGTNYENSCQLDLTPYVGANSTAFYELFLVDVNQQLYPVPIKVLNLRRGDGSTPNRNSDGSEAEVSTNVLSRRFYLVDALAGKVQFNAAPRVLSYMRSATLRVEMHGSSTSEIRPPLLVIDYGERLVADILDGDGKQLSAVSFTTIYLKDSGGFWSAAHGLFGTAIALAVIMVIRRLWVWQRKTGSEVLEINLIMFVRFIVYLFSALGDLFFIMICALSFYCWLFYKGQQTVYYLLPTTDGSEVQQLRAFAIVCFVAKLCDVLFKIYTQIQVDIFFMDWEKPKGSLGDAGGASDDETSAPPSVSVWRKLFAANKWNDLQSARLLNVPFTLFFMIFLMEPSGIGLKYLATAQPSPSNLESTAAPLHPILVFAVNTFFLLCICYLQLVFHKQILNRYFKDEVAQFVDLLCTSNISAFILDERQHGYYVHGKTVHPHADVSLEEMNAAIQAEEKNLTRPRGLDIAAASGHGGTGAGAKASNHDSFEFYATHAWRATYDDLYTRLLHKQAVHAARAQRSAARGNMDLSSDVELGRMRGLGRGSGGTMADEHAAAGALDSASLISATLMRANASLNAWLCSFINREPQFPYPYDHAQHDLTRRILGLPVALPTHAPCTLFDDPGFGFTSVLLCGIEPDLILFLVQLYAVCNLLFESILVATLVCYIVDRLLCAFRSHWGQINIAKKTLLDDRFLI